jgi:hypothetical protein
MFWFERRDAGVSLQTYTSAWAPAPPRSFAINSLSISACQKKHAQKKLNSFFDSSIVRFLDFQRFPYCPPKARNLALEHFQAKGMPVRVKKMR